jgi:dTDP-glucose 4,6-dehydratase
MNLLITGGAGFIGSNFVEYMSKKYDYKLIILDKLTYAGNIKNLDGIRYDDFIKGDICDYDLVYKLCKSEKIDIIINFAAETHVDNSIKNPSNFIRTNINGTFNLLEIVKDLGIKLFHISTDEVYGSLEKDYADENYPYKPNSPYSASKASSDLLVRSYVKTYNIKAIAVNMVNNFGQKQHTEKLIPTIIKNAIDKKPIPIYGNGKNVRDWLYVGESVKALDLIMHKSNWPNKYNIGANNQKTNIEIANLICEILNEIKPIDKDYKEFITFVKDRPGHDFRYAVNFEKLKKLGWSIENNFYENLKKTVKWYLKEMDDITHSG